MTRHSNILGFIAADLCDRDGVTQMLILTEYHRRGSLHSYLENEELTMDSFLRLAGSVAKYANSGNLRLGLECGRLRLTVTVDTATFSFSPNFAGGHEQ